jgi:lysozyme
MSRRVNAETVALIKQWEGLRLEAYICPTGHPTIGYGHTATARMGQTITEIEAERLLRQDLMQFEAAIERLVRVPLSEGQFGALVSWAFNVGVGAVQNSTLLRRLNNGEYESVPTELARWNKGRVNGQLVVLPGLTNRRAAEVGLWVRAAHVAGRDVVAEAPEPGSMTAAAQTDTGLGALLPTLMAGGATMFAGLQGLDWRVVAAIVTAGVIGYLGTLYWRSKRS